MTRVGCKVPGCAGRVDVELVDSHLVESPCPLCARRGVWAAAMLPSTHAMSCTICTASIPARRTGKPRKYCDACVPLAARLRWQRCNAKRARAARAA